MTSLLPIPDDRYSKFLFLCLQTQPDGTATRVSFEDLSIDGHPDASTVEHSKRVDSKRSISEQNNQIVEDEEQSLTATDTDQHWLWGGITRLKRSVSGMFSLGDDHKSKHKSEANRRTKSHPQKRKRSHAAVLRAHPKTDRSKRQDSDYGDDFDLEDDDEDHLNGGSGEGLNVFDNSDLLPNEQGARLCKSNAFSFNACTPDSHVKFISVRMRFTIQEIWVQQYSDRKSSLFKNISKSLAQAVEELYSAQTNDIDDEIYAHVVQLQ